MEEYRFRVPEELEGERADKCLSLLMDSLSRSYIQKLIGEGRVLVEGRPVKASFQVSEDDELCLYLPPSREPLIQPENIPLDILYEDASLLVVNKPKGMVVHPAPGHYSGTLVNALLYHCRGELSGINGVLRPGIVHRIDRDTTGSLLVCKNDRAHSAIAAQLKAHSIRRLYYAVCRGVLPRDEGTVDGPLARDPRDRKRMAVFPKGTRGAREAVTHYRVLERFREYTYIECRLETGRTHQIRVHMASLGHPLLGDPVYGGGKSPFHLEGQTLHAGILGFIHPDTGKYIEINAPLPEYFVHLLKILE